jgi:hypothetical protein
VAIDFDALCRNPIYEILKTSATYQPVTGPAETIDIIDQTRGEVIQSQSADGASVTVPTVHVKAGIVDDPAEGGTLTISGVVYRIDDSLPLPGPGGVSSGEVALMLSRVA